ncbi:M48 family metalloprotease [Phycisphaeraceae bacterium D3-23]
MLETNHDDAPMRRDVTSRAAVDRWLSEIETLHGRLPDLRPPMMFRVAAGVSALVVLGVAVAYLALVCGMVWMALEYLISHIRLMTSGTPMLSVVFYLVFAVVALVLVLFLIKPVFRLGESDLAPRELSRSEQPELYRFVEGMCDALKTPRPHKIQVVIDANASASLHGICWGIFSRKPVLTLGLTLVSGVEVHRLTGIIAHELAHFSQHGGMRFMRIVNSVNQWFARMVYERDAFDLKLLQLASIPILGLPFRVATWAVGLGRIVLWFFMLLAHASSGIISRRGEYDADRVMAAVVGSDNVPQTISRVGLLDVAMNTTRGDLNHSLREHRLADSIPALAVARANSITPERKDQVLRLMRLDKTRWYDTHPSLAHRTRAARKLDYPALFTDGAPADQLIAGIDTIAREQTHDVYKLVLGDDLKQMKIIPTDVLVEEIDTMERSGEALARFYQGRALINRPILPGPDATVPPAGFEDAAILQRAARDTMVDSAKDLHKELDKLVELDERLHASDLAARLVRAGFQIDPGVFMLRDARPQAIAQAHAETQRQYDETAQRVAAYESTIEQRVTTAARLLRSDMLRDSFGDDEIREARRSMGRLQACAPRLVEIAHEAHTLGGLLNPLVLLLQNKGQSTRPKHAQQEIDRVTAGVREVMERLRTRHADTEYPFVHADANATLGGYLVENMPRTADPAELVFVAGETVERCEAVVARAMAQSADLAERVETALGFEQEAMPKLEDEFEQALREAERHAERRPDAAATYAAIPAMAAAALVAIGLFLGAVTVGTAAPTVNSKVVPHHPSYQPTIVPTTFVESRGPAYDPYNLFTPPTPSAPNYYTPPHEIDPYAQPGMPGQPRVVYPPGHPNYRPGQNQPGYPNHPTDPRGNQPTYPGQHNPNSPTRPGQPGYQPGRPPNRPTPGRTSPNRPSPGRPNVPSRPSPGGPSPGGGGGFPSGPGGF